MANEVVKINGVTKKNYQNFIFYYHPLAIIVGDTNLDRYIETFNNDKANQRTILFSDVTDKLGQATLEQYLDELCIQELYFNPEQVSSVDVENLTTTETDTTKVLQPDGVGGVVWNPNIALQNRIIVTQANVATTLGGIIDPTKEYFIDGVIDLGSVSVEIPPAGIYLAGYNFDLSKLTSSENNYTMFTSPVGGSGNVVRKDLGIEVTGTNSQQIDIVGATGFEAIEDNRINWNNCTSLGEIDNYRQGFESGTGRFGGSPSLTLTGAWAGGYFINSSIARNIGGLGGGALFKAGTGFVMQSRFRSNQNLDLGASAAFFDFSDTNFPNPSTIQILDTIISRNGVIDPTDTTLYPNIDEDNLSCKWVNNIGFPNTFEGGKISVASENLTTIPSGSTWVTLNAVWSASELSHFAQDTTVLNAGALRHDGISPREYQVIIDFVIEGQQNNDIGIRIRKWDNSASTFINFAEERRQINALVGGRDVAFFNLIDNIALDQGDYIYFQVRNNSGNQNVTLELDSSYRIQTR